VNITLLEKIIPFWFADEHKQKWFAKDPDFDQLIIETFEPLYESLKHQKPHAWIDKPEFLLALIILFDQFPRNMYRGITKSFETDPKALALTHYSLQKRIDKGFDLEKQLFLYMPLMHSEDLKDQELSLKLFPDMNTFASAHYEIIKRYGRFPHRNAILGRASTPEEQEFLKQPNSSF
jgi:uncharacterized protein (DUF924 family)